MFDIIKKTINPAAGQARIPIINVIEGDTLVFTTPRALTKTSVEALTAAVKVITENKFKILVLEDHLEIKQILHRVTPENKPTEGQ